MAWFGLDKALDKPVEEARAMVAETVDKLSPLFSDIARRTAILVHGVIDRIKFKVDIQIELLPDQTRYPKAEKPGARTPTI